MRITLKQIAILAFATVIVWANAPQGFSEVTLPSVFSNHMVLQRGKPVPIWGKADPGEEVHIQLEGAQLEDAELVKTTADSEGKWKANLPARKAGGPLKLVVEGKESRTQIDDIYFGEVWVCSGQSNMELPVSRAQNAKEEIANAKYPTIRMFTVPRLPANTPQDDCKGSWKVCSPETVGNFSAVGYFFARKLQKELNVPVGMLHTSWGGTRAEAWTSKSALAANEKLKPILDRTDKIQGKQHRGAHLFNGMIQPILGYGIRGAIWYQGESNVGRAEQYATLFPTMITDWRSRWGQGDFPFYFIQLAPFRYGRSDPVFCAELWDAQFKTYRTIANTGMIVTTDIATLRNIHPPNKQDAGKRLALWALAKTYGKDVAYSGPLYKSFRVDGDKIVLEFDFAEGLKARDDKPLVEFTIAGEDKKFVPAKAKIEGDKVIVWSDEIKAPVAVRMGWHDTAQPNLVNAAGLPASPFRTDNWKLKTAGKY